MPRPTSYAVCFLENKRPLRAHRGGSRAAPRRLPHHGLGELARRYREPLRAAGVLHPSSVDRRTRGRALHSFPTRRSSDLLMAVNIHITIIELNALHTKRQNLFQELDAVIHLLMEAKHWGLRKSRNATSLNSRFKSLDTLKVKIISVTFRRVIRTNHK